VAALGAKHDAIDDEADDSRQEHHERVHDALQQRERDHVAIRHVAHLVAEDGLDLFRAELPEQARADRDERLVAVHSGGESIDVRRIVDCDLRALDAGLAWRCTVFSSQLSVALRGVSITCAPVICFAIHFDIASEMNEPVKPITAEKTSSASRSSAVPWLSRSDSMPSSCSTTVSTTRTAMFVATNSSIRFIRLPRLNRYGTTLLYRGPRCGSRRESQGSAR